MDDQCRFLSPCPCGCGWGMCGVFGEFVEPDSDCGPDCEYWEEIESEED